MESVNTCITIKIMVFYIRKILLRLVIVSVAILMVTGCSHFTETRPQDVIGLLIKCRDLLRFCILLLNLDPPVYSITAERYYYAMLSLARIVAQPSRTQNVHRTGYHERVWSACDQSVQNAYGRQLKELRVRCDYGNDAVSRNQDLYRRELKPIVANANAFESLANSVIKVYNGMSPRTKYNDDCDALMTEINCAVEEIRKNLK